MLHSDAGPWWAGVVTAALHACHTQGSADHTPPVSTDEFGKVGVDVAALAFDRTHSDQVDGLVGNECGNEDLHQLDGAILVANNIETELRCQSRT